MIAVQIKKLLKTQFTIKVVRSSFKSELEKAYCRMTAQKDPFIVICTKKMFKDRFAC